MIVIVIEIILPFKSASTESKIGFPTVSGNRKLNNPDNIEKIPIMMNGKDGLVRFRLSVRNGAREAPTRADTEPRLSPCVL